MEFREELRRQALGLRGNLPDDWENTAEVLRQSCLVHRLDRANKETLSWNNTVQESIHIFSSQGDEGIRQDYWLARNTAH